MVSFIFGGNTGISSPRELAERRDLVRALAARSAGHVPQNPWEGLVSLSEAIGQRVEKGQLDRAEAEGRASGDAAFAPLAEALRNNKTPDSALLTGALSSEWLSPSQRSQAEMLYKQHLEATRSRIATPGSI